MNKEMNLGIDIGGTKINIGLVDESGQVMVNSILATDRNLDCKAQIGQVAGEIKNLLKENGLSLWDVSFLGAGVPGTVAHDTGFVTCCPNLGWVDQPVGEYFKEFLGREVLVCQDAKNAALAEFLFGAGKGLSDILCLTVGTGIGCGIILNKKLHFGAFETAGEFGHMILHKDGRACGCGKKGCIERYTSGTGILDHAIEQMPYAFKDSDPRTETVFELAQEGNEQARCVINDCVEDLAIGIANAVNLLGVEAVIISGGVCEHEELFIKPLKEMVLKYGYIGWTQNERFRLSRAMLGKDAPMIGAAVLKKGI